MTIFVGGVAGLITAGIMMPIGSAADPEPEPVAPAVPQGVELKCFLSGSVLSVKVPCTGLKLDPSTLMNVTSTTTP